MGSAREQLPLRPYWGLSLDMPSFERELHHHDSWELTEIEEGTGMMIAGSSVHAYGPGDVVLIAPDVPHCWISAEKSTARSRAQVLGFAEDVADLIRQEPDASQVADLLRAAHATALVSTRGETRTANVVTEVASLGDLFQLLESLPSYDWTAFPGGQPLTADPLTRLRVERVYAYVLDNAAGEVRLAGAAQSASVSPQSFSRFFGLATGKTFRSFVVEVRLSIACQLLRDSDTTIANIASRSGFTNLANFNRRFRDRFGITPREYRRAQRLTIRPESARAQSPGAKQA